MHWDILPTTVNIIKAFNWLILADFISDVMLLPAFEAGWKNHPFQRLTAVFATEDAVSIRGMFRNGCKRLGKKIVMWIEP